MEAAGSRLQGWRREAACMHFSLPGLLLILWCALRGDRQLGTSIHDSPLLALRCGDAADAPRPPA